MICIVDLYTGRPMQVANSWIYTLLGLIIGITVLFYVLRSIGLYKLAKNKGLKRAYFAWIPCLWSYTAGQLVEEKVAVFGKRIKKFALFFAIVYTTATLFTIAYYLVIYIPLVGYLIQGQGDAIVYLGAVEGAVEWLGTGIYTEPTFQNPYAFSTAFTVIKYILISMTSILDILNIFFSVTMYIYIFKLYWPLHSWSALVFCILGFFPVVVFIIRNKKEVDMDAFVRQRYGANTYNNQYGNPYNANGSASAPKNDDPFGEFSSNDDDPFSEFGGDDNDKR